MRFFILLSVFFLLGGVVNGQSLDELRKKKQKTNEQIKQTAKLLEDTKKNQAKTLNKFKILNKQIELRTNLISGINSEVSVLSGFIDQNAWLVASMNNDMEELKKEYAKMIVFAQMNQTKYDKLLFILSANSFNQAYKRFMYLRHYTEYRQRQAELIEWIRYEDNGLADYIAISKYSRYRADLQRRETFTEAGEPHLRDAQGELLPRRRQAHPAGAAGPPRVLRHARRPPARKRVAAGPAALEADQPQL